MNNLLNTKYPIIQGAMANISDAEFASSVSNAGALGVIASGGMTANDLEAEIIKCKLLTDKPFGVNVMLMNPEKDQIIEVIIKHKIKFVTTGAGNPGKYIPALKENGCKVFPVVASVALARRMEKLGADAIIAEGTESGGHVGELTTLVLLPQVKAAVSIPVIAAGGIANGNSMLAVEVLGASMIQIGTCLLVSKECKIHQNYKDIVKKAKDISTIVTGRSKNTPVRIYKNQMATQYVKLENSDDVNSLEFEKLTLGSLKKAVVDGDKDGGSFMMGQIAGLISEESTLEEIFKNFMTEYNLAKKQILER
jgi:enoyl-[acyl-carrier protein] reductase II